MNRNIYSTRCPNCKKEQELLQVVGKLIKSKKKSVMRFECDNCAFTSPIIIHGKDVFYKRSEITVDEEHY